MKAYQSFLQAAIIIGFVLLNAYAFGNGIRLHSTWGILFSLGSIAALVYCIHLFRQLNKLESEEEEGYF